jgi:hypothetical protein
MKPAFLTEKDYRQRKGEVKITKFGDMPLIGITDVFKYQFTGVEFFNGRLTPGSGMLCSGIRTKSQQNQQKQDEKYS